MIKTLAIANQKGGCGKTTVAVNLSACLALHGRRTLLVDMDPQGHCALGLAVPEEQIELSMYDALSVNGQPTDLTRIIWQITKNFDLAPSTVELAGLEQELSGRPGREKRLGDALNALEDRYDYCLIDCPPSVGLLTFNALRAAHAVIIPVETGYFSLHGLSKQLETIELLQQQCGHTLAVKVVPNLYDVRTKLGREMLAELRKRFSQFMFKTHINFNTKLKEGASLGQAITEYEPHSPGFRDFDQLAREIIGQFEPLEITTTDADEVDLITRAEQLTERARELLAESAQTLGHEPSASHEPSAEEKIEMIYGATPTEDGIRFLAKFPSANTVHIAGDFNNWSAQATPLSVVPSRQDDWQTIVPLESGRYRYRFVVDGVWQQDPHNGYVESNPYGELNSVIEV